METTHFRDGMTAALPTALGYIAIGLACGVIGANSGIAPWQMLLMSTFIYAGSGQFAFCALLVAKADLTLITTTIFLINLRHLLMSLHVTTIFSKASLRQGILIGTLLTDESYGVLLNRHVKEVEVPISWMHGNNLTSYLTWIAATVTGTLLAASIPTPEHLGLDFALVAMFVCIFESQLRAILAHVPWKTICLILLAVTLSYSLASVILSESLAILFATLTGCLTGVSINDDY